MGSWIWHKTIPCPGHDINCPRWVGLAPRPPPRNFTKQKKNLQKTQSTRSVVVLPPQPLIVGLRDTCRQDTWRAKPTSGPYNPNPLPIFARHPATRNNIQQFVHLLQFYRNSTDFSTCCVLLRPAGLGIIEWSPINDRLSYRLWRGQPLQWQMVVSCTRLR